MTEHHETNQFQFFNLFASLESINNKPLRYKIKGRIEKIRSLTTSLADLQTTNTSLRQITEISGHAQLKEEYQNEYTSNICAALFSQAIITYARATQTTSEVRVPSGIIDCYNQEQRSKHRRIMRYRNDAIAHYGRADEAWSSETVVLRTHPTKPSIILVPHHMFNYKYDVAQPLREINDDAIAICQELTQRKRQDLLTYINTLDNLSKTEITSVKFDALKFFKSNISAENFYKEIPENTWTLKSRPDQH